jgi:hypothetical protein
MTNKQIPQAQVTLDHITQKKSITIHKYAFSIWHLISLQMNCFHKAFIDKIMHSPTYAIIITSKNLQMEVLNTQALRCYS